MADREGQEAFDKLVCMDCGEEIPGREARPGPTCRACFYERMWGEREAALVRVMEWLARLAAEGRYPTLHMGVTEAGRPGVWVTLANPTTDEALSLWSAPAEPESWMDAARALSDHPDLEPTGTGSGEREAVKCPSCGHVQRIDPSRLVEREVCNNCGERGVAPESGTGEDDVLEGVADRDVERAVERLGWGSTYTGSEGDRIAVREYVRELRGFARYVAENGPDSLAGEARRFLRRVSTYSQSRREAKNL